jgi:hypothetical protein
MLSAAVGGLAAGVAILIRPNLAPLAAILALWLITRRRFLPVGLFAVFASAGGIAVAAINLKLYGSALRSGYDLTDAFATANIVPNLARYGRWLIETGNADRAGRLGVVGLDTPMAAGGAGRGGMGELPSLCPLGRVVVPAVSVTRLADDGRWQRIAADAVATYRSGRRVCGPGVDRRRPILAA